MNAKIVLVCYNNEVLLGHAVDSTSHFNVELNMIAGTPHSLLIDKPYIYEVIIIDFLTRERVQTIALIDEPGQTGRTKAEIAKADQKRLF